MPRPRLLERLDRGVQGKLTLVSAPAGFGKTALLAEWLAASDRRVAWLSLDQGESQPNSFWIYLIAALRTVEPEVGARALALLQSPQPPPMESLLAGLINDIGAVADDFVLVLDDYHLVENRAVHEGIAFLIEHLPRPMHLLIAGRADPPLPLARLRGRGELTEIRAADLRFTPDEAAAFLNQAMGLELSARDAAVLDARTEGWIAGLQLAALSMQGRDDAAAFIAEFTGDDRYVVDYLVEEVLQRQPDDVRQFLLRTSILDRLSGPLCDAVTGDEDGRAMLESLERRNLFVVPLDDRRQWYRYHHLFADVLQSHLRAEHAERVPELQGRASAWFQQNGQPSDAIRHALASGNLARVAALAEVEAEAVVRSSRTEQLVEWLRPVPMEILQTMPVLSTYYSFALFGFGRLEEAAVHLANAERVLANPPAGADSVALAELPARIALAHSFFAMATGDTARTIAMARRALDLFPEDEHLWRGGAAILVALAHWGSGDLDLAQPFHADGIASLEKAGSFILAISASYDAAELLKARGRLTEARRTYERALQLAVRAGDAAMPGVADIHLGLSELACEQDDLSGAEEHLRRGEELSRSGSRPETPYRLRVAQARLRQLRGDLSGAADLLGQAERLYVRGPVPDTRPIGATRARLWLAQGRRGEALTWTLSQGLFVDDAPSYRLQFNHLTLARVLLAQSAGAQPLRDADGLLDRLLEAAKVGGRTGAVIEILLLRALLQGTLGDAAARLGHLQRALTLAAPEGYVRLFVDEGSPMRDLLRQAAAAGIETQHVRRLLAAFEGETRPTIVAAAGLEEPLTAREIEVLRLVAAVLRNQEIADQLVISLPTVKRHIANGYGKLGVTHRTEAVARAIELGVL